MRRYDLTARELSDMREQSRDSVKYIDGGFRELVETRHCSDSDEVTSEDTGDRMLGSRFA